jgi:dimethylglycine dehydrogenase
VYTQTFGWERPKWFSLDGRAEQYSYRRSNVFELIRDECLAVRERVGILDLSGFAKYDLTGPDAEAFLNRVCANRVPVNPGRIILAHILSEAGRIQAEMTVTRLAADRFYLLSAAGAELRDLDFLSQGRLPNEQVSIKNVTNDRGVLVLAGPNSRHLLSTLTDTPLDNVGFPWLTGKEIRVVGKPVRALRVNYVGELGWELHAAMADMKAIYDAIWATGQEFALSDFGLYAVNSLRIEKAYRGWGAELTNEVTMLEACMDRFIRFDKDDFVGKQATLKQAEQGLSWKLVYFEIDAVDSDILGGEPVFDGDLCIGVTTSGGYGHRVQKSLGFAYVEIAYAGAGTCFDVDLLGDRCGARVLAEPAYDPGNDKLRVK